MARSIGSLIIIVRAALEDRMLQAELPGYEEDAARAKDRLVPLVWPAADIFTLNPLFERS